MTNITLAQCKHATSNGFFRIQKLNLTEPLSIEDMVCITEYLRITPVTGIDFTFILTKENSYGFEQLSKVIADNEQLKTFRFKVQEFDFGFKYRNNPQLQLLGFIDDYRVKKINSRVINALIEMLDNKPDLSRLDVDLLIMETALSTSQAKLFARKIARSPLESLDMSFAVEQGSELPILSKNETNNRLKYLSLRHSIYGTSLLNTLESATGLKTLVINEMLFSSMDLETLAKIFKFNPSLRMLDLGKTNLGQLDSSFIFGQIGRCKHLEILGLPENNLSGYSVDALCRYLSKESCSITELNLSRNDYTSTDVIKIAAALTTNTKLEKLTIDDVLAEDQGLQAVFKLLRYNSRIRSVSMSNNCRYHPSDETINHLIALLRDPECQIRTFSFSEQLSLYQLKLLTDAILVNKSLRSVRLNYSDFSLLGDVFKYKIEQHLTRTDSELVTADIETVSETSDVILSDDLKPLKPVAVDYSNLCFFTETSEQSDASQLTSLKPPQSPRMQ